MAEVGSAFVSILPSARGFGSKLESEVSGEVSGSGKSIGGKFGSAFKVGALAVLAGAALTANFLKGAIDEARDAQKVTAITEAAIKSMGDVAGISAEQVGKLAEAISLKTGIDDEQIQSSSNLLLSFGKVANAGKGVNAIFDRATQASVDLSVRGFGSMDSTAKQLGKALNDPIKGVSALGKAGVTFSEDQKLAIAKMVETGDLLGAQKIILGEVERQVKGSAEAQATAADKVSVAWGNFKEQIGTALLPVLDRLFNQVLLPGISALSTAFKEGGLGGVVDMISEKITAALPTIKAKLAEWGMAFWDWLKDVTPPLLVRLGNLLLDLTAWIVNVAIPATAAKLVEWGKAFYDWIIPQIPPMLEKLGILLGRLIVWVLDEGLPKLQKNMQKWGEALIRWIGPKTGPLLEEMGKLLGRLIVWMNTVALPKLIACLGKMGLELVKWIAKKQPEVMSAIAQLMGRFITYLATEATPAIAAKFTIMGVKGMVALKDAIKSGISKVVGLIATLPARIVNSLGNLGSLLFNAGKSIIQGLIDGVASMIGTLKSKLGEITSLIPDVKGPPEKDAVLLRPAGQLIMRGLIDGIDSGIEPLTHKLEEVTGKILEGLESKRDAIKSVLDGLKSDFASLRDGISSTFTGNLFEAETAGGFIENLMGTRKTLNGLKAAFKKLVGYGLSPSFLSQLFASGNGGLILDLASGPRDDARQAQALFGSVSTISGQLGSQVAKNDIGPKIDRQTEVLQDIRHDIRQLHKRLGGEINGAATRGHKNRRATA